MKHFGLLLWAIFIMCAIMPFSSAIATLVGCYVVGGIIGLIAAHIHMKREKQWAEQYKRDKEASKHCATLEEWRENYQGRFRMTEAVMLTILEDILERERLVKEGLAEQPIFKNPAIQEQYKDFRNRARRYRYDHVHYGYSDEKYVPQYIKDGIEL